MLYSLHLHSAGRQLNTPTVCVSCPPCLEEALAGRVRIDSRMPVGAEPPLAVCTERAERPAFNAQQLHRIGLAGRIGSALATLAPNKDTHAFPPDQPRSRGISFSSNIWAISRAQSVVPTVIPSPFVCSHTSKALASLAFPAYRTTASRVPSA